MAKNRRKIQYFAIAGGGVLAASVAGVVMLSGSSHAQDSQAQTATTKPAFNRQAPTFKPTAADSHAVPAAATAAQPPAAQSAAQHPILLKVAPALLRKPNAAPAKVQWSAALSQSARMQQVRKPNNLALRLPKAQLDKVRLPVLLPREGIISTINPRLMSFGDAYALNLPQAKGTQITMYGNRSLVAADKGAISSRPIAKIAGVPEDIRISQIEDGWTATFTRYGVVYSIDVSCDAIDSPDCQNDGYIRKAIAQFDDVTLGADAQNEAKDPAPAPDWLKNITGAFAPKKRG